MRRQIYEATAKLPDEAQVTVEDGEVTVEGPEGRLSRVLDHPKLDLTIDGDTVRVRVEAPKRQDAALAKTWVSHIRNMAAGVVEPYTAELRIVYSHFPIRAKVEGDDLVVENFLGERHPRRAPILGDVEVEVDDDIVRLTGSDKEDVGQTAANIERATSIRGYDPRVFQDGIYITKKPRSGS